MAIHVELNHEFYCWDSNVRVGTKVKAWKHEQIEWVFKDSNTFSQVWEGESRVPSGFFTLKVVIDCGVLNLWDKSANRKWCPNHAFFRLLTFFLKNVDIKNEFTFSIWEFKVQIMANRVLVNQIGNLIMDH